MTVKGAVRRSLTLARLSSTARSVVRDRLTYLSPEKIRNLERCIRDVNSNRVPGDFLEAGIALGGSAIILASQLGPDRSFHGYDVFDQIPPPTAADDVDSHARYETIASGASDGIDGDVYYGYVPDLLEKVKQAFGRYGISVDDRRVTLHPGLFEDTLHPQGPVAVAHLDCDWYDPTLLCLRRITPALSVGGYMIVDDYNSYRGCRQAVDEFLSDRPDILRVVGSPNLVLRRN
jgi:asparagine synthase (glutamine-hydrolysing)